jgi:protein SSD1
VKENAEQHAVKMEVASRSVHDERALFDEDDGDDEIVLGHDNDEAAEEEVESAQRDISKARVTPEFEGLKTTAAGHKIQQVKELMTVPVIVTADLTKSPPVIKVYSVNPYAEQRARH